MKRVSIFDQQSIDRPQNKVIFNISDRKLSGKTNKTIDGNLTLRLTYALTVTVTCTDIDL